jgi:hypothetical protein
MTTAEPPASVSAMFPFGDLSHLNSASSARPGGQKNRCPHRHCSGVTWWGVWRAPGCGSASPRTEVRAGAVRRLRKSPPAA